MNESANYIKIVEWSAQDEAFVGRCPGVMGPCCHGEDEVEVYRQLCEIVADWLAILAKDGRELPPATAGLSLAELPDDAIAEIRDGTLDQSSANNSINLDPKPSHKIVTGKTLRIGVVDHKDTAKQPKTCGKAKFLRERQRKLKSKVSTGDKRRLNRVLRTTK